MVLKTLEEHKLYAKLKKCKSLLEKVRFLGHIETKDGISVNPAQVKENLTYIEEPIWILEKKEKKLRNRSISYIKVLWKHHKVAEATLHYKGKHMKNTPRYFYQLSNFKDEILLRGESVRAALSFYC